MLAGAAKVQGSTAGAACASIAAAAEGRKNDATGQTLLLRRIGASKKLASVARDRIDGLERQALLDKI